MALSLTLGTNTFITLSDAETYFEGRLNVNTWDNASESDKNKALVMATKKLDQYNYIGYKKVATQALRFPREYESYYNRFDDSFLLSVDDYPREIEEATCEEALALLDNIGNEHNENINNGIKSIGLGDEQITYKDGARANKLLSLEARQLIKRWTKKGFASA